MEKKSFEIIWNGTSYGFYETTDKDDALEVQSREASFESFAHCLNVTEKTYEQAMDEVLVIETEIKDIRVGKWEDDQSAIFFTLVRDEDEIETLEWIDEEGEIERRDSHLSVSHNFNRELVSHVHEKLEEWMAVKLAA